MDRPERLAGNLERSADERQPICVEWLRQHRLVPDEQQVARRVHGRRLGVQQLARPPVDQAGHIDTLLVSRALHVIQEVTAIWQEMRRQVTGLTVSDLRHRFHCAAAVGCDAQNRAGRIPNEQDGAVAVPAAASAPFARGDRAHQPTIEIHSLQAASGVERNRPSVQ